MNNTNPLYYLEEASGQGFLKTIKGAFNGRNALAAAKKTQLANPLRIANANELKAQEIAKSARSKIQNYLDDKKSLDDAYKFARRYSATPHTDMLNSGNRVFWKDHASKKAYLQPRIDNLKKDFQNSKNNLKTVADDAREFNRRVAIVKKFDPKTIKYYNGMKFGSFARPYDLNGRGLILPHLDPIPKR